MHANHARTNNVRTLSYGAPAHGERRAAARASAVRLYAPRRAAGGQRERRSRWRPRRTHSAAEAGTTTVAHAAHACSENKQTKPKETKQRLQERVGTAAVRSSGTAAAHCRAVADVQ